MELRFRAEASGCLVGPAVFKTVEGVTSPLAGSIPVRLRQRSWGKGFRLPVFDSDRVPGVGRPQPGADPVPKTHLSTRISPLRVSANVPSCTH